MASAYWESVLTKSAVEYPEKQHGRLPPYHDNSRSFLPSRKGNDARAGKSRDIHLQPQLASFHFYFQILKQKIIKAHPHFLLWVHVKTTDVVKFLGPLEMDLKTAAILPRKSKFNLMGWMLRNKDYMCLFEFYFSMNHVRVPPISPRKTFKQVSNRQK